jgi:hypothetical protein
VIFGRFSTFFFAEVALRETNLGFAISLHLSRAGLFPKMMFCLEGKMFEKGMFRWCTGMDASTLPWTKHSLLQTCLLMRTWMLLLDVWMLNYSVNLSHRQTVFMFYLLLINENFTPPDRPRPPMPRPCT